MPLERTRMHFKWDSARGILPVHVTNLSQGYRIKVYVEERLFCDVPVTEVLPLVQQHLSAVLADQVSPR